ncbi:WD repeat-containing protein 20-like [Scyliorhinus canicula]|uniref:WD repeat-containing protein 20-like n=1 Tax=Scyliorhinus canicula TaxID=7830 RepID=UPI0018F62D6C|nr:WD repeat-containing protein 20-like [Scyliorhinus canicula]
MAAEGGGKELNEIKSQFWTREGAYQLLSLSEYSRPNRMPLSAAQGTTPVRVSLVNVREPSAGGQRICFNVGRELYLYLYRGPRKDLLSAQNQANSPSGTVV